MHKITPKLLVDILKSEELRIRTGILLLPNEFRDSESEIAVNLGIDHQNICTRILLQTPPNKKLLGISRNYILDNIDAVLSDKCIPGRCLLIAGIELLLAAISHEEVMHFWDSLRNNFRRERGVLISFPVSAKLLLPLDEIRLWNEIERIALWGAPENVL